MYLSKIEIIGFKSFAQRTNLNFDAGLTAIVGPNGCGKTNIVDAIRWALGEQRYSTLRSDKMEDVIFNGTKNRQAPRPGRGVPHHREHQGHPPERVLRGDDHPPRLPLRRERIPAEQGALPPEGHPEPVHGHRDGQRRLLGHRAEDDRDHPERQQRRAPETLRGGRRRDEVQGPPARRPCGSSTRSSRTSRGSTTS